MNPVQLVQPLAIAGLGVTELLIIASVVVLIFGASRLPALARGSGQALRIFKAETKALTEDDHRSEPVTTATAPDPVVAAPVVEHRPTRG